MLGHSSLTTIRRTQSKYRRKIEIKNEEAPELEFWRKPSIPGDPSKSTVDQPTLYLGDDGLVTWEAFGLTQIDGPPSLVGSS